MSTVTFVIDEHEVLPLEEWRHLVKRRAGYRCERCGAGDKVLHAHHKNHRGKRDDSDNRLANGECLCVSCHNETRTEDPVDTGTGWSRAQLDALICECGRAPVKRGKERCFQCGREEGARIGALRASTQWRETMEWACV